VSTNIGTLPVFSSGTVASASSELGPSTPTSDVSVAIIFCAAGTASAGSPRVSSWTQLI
jgi:hypothetical protein